MPEEDESHELPQFRGLANILDLIQHLYRRRHHRDQPPGGRELPMVCLIRPEEHSDLLPAISERLTHGVPHRVPHALIELEPPPDVPAPAEEAGPPVETVRALLLDIADELSNSRNATTGRLRFPRLSLAAWLMNEALSSRDDTLPSLRSRLRERQVSRRIGDMISTANAQAPNLPGWLSWVPAVLAVLPPVWFRIKSSGRLPLLSSEYRWFLRQPYLAAEVPGTFIGFAERLTKHEWPKEATEQVLRFLTNAFLEDLRQEYPRYSVRGARQTANVIVLLDNITLANGGYRLLKLINDVRNDIGRPDPLLVITASRKLPPHAEKPAGAGSGYSAYDATSAAGGCADWRRQLRTARRQRKEVAWYLPIRTSTAPLDSTPSEPDEFTLDAPPWWSRRLTTTCAVALLAATCVTGYTSWSRDHCAGGLGWPGLTPSLTYVDQECIGITDGSHAILQPADPLLDQVRLRILRQNRRAEELHRAQPERPYVTLAYVGALTSSSGDPGGLVAKREELAGLAVAQADKITVGAPTPLVRVLLVNAGRNMLHGPRVARQLGDMAASDPRLIGVIGLDRSSHPTVRTIQALGQAGLPMVAGALTADGISAAHAMYYQVAPQNRRQAEVAAELVRQLHVQGGAPQLRIDGFTNKVRIYYSANSADIYSSNLREDVAASMAARGFAVEAVPFASDAAYTAAQSACGFDGVIYYAGRGVPEFDQFLAGIANTCGNTPPLILGGHDTSRYVANGDRRQRNRSVPFLFQTSAVAPSRSNPNDDDTLLNAERDFYSELRRLFPFEGTAEGRSLDGHAALTHDAALSMLTAVQYVVEKNIPISPAAVWRELNDIHNSAEPGARPMAITGATGMIDFGGDLSRHVPLNKPVAILQVRGGEVHPSVVGFCGGPPNPDRPREVDHPCPPPE